ncbi:hypothetical protein Scep_009655 [Stephania cephalantha]|uniref:CRC domain-containing protein n=1 Tax=Stephania cephalantha TaxID=152367 RepID=A0AAP0PEJ1_9MAGN
MDTPERNQIGTPISKFEDSPVFNYINSLSPIKPVKSTHITHTFNSLNFTSPPSVFTSPHVTYARESRFLRRHCSPESSKPVSSESGHEQNTSVPISDTVQASGPPVSPPESSGQGISIGEVTVDPTAESSELAIELPRTLKYDCGSPDGDQVPVDITQVDAVPVMSGTSKSLVQFVLETSMEGHQSFESRTGLPTTCQVEQTKEEIGCDWENLISDAADLLAFDSPDNIVVQKPRDQNLVTFQTSFTSLVSEFAPDSVENIQKAQLLTQVASQEQREMEELAGQNGQVAEKNETDHTPQLLSGDMQNQQGGGLASEKMNDKAGHSIQFGCKLRGIRRRCLVFETGNAQKKKLEDDSNSCSSISSHSEEKVSSEVKPLVPVRPGSSPCILPGIGLHLNALAATTKDLAVVKHETVIAGKQLISMPCSSATFHSLSSERKSFKSLALSSIKTDVDPASSNQVTTSDASRASAFKAGDELNESSPKKKRRRLEHAGESEGCKRCNCKKSKCLKLYCECFAAGVYCVEPCSCQECFNKPIHEDTVLATRKQIESRNPLAFAPKVIRSSESNADIGEDSNKTPSSARHKRGCNCKKSNCLKKYCECYQGGVGCSINCRCEGCKNGFGRKDGSTPLNTEETEVEDEEIEISEKDGADKRAQNNEAYESEEQYPDPVVPITFSFQICRSTSVHLPFSIGKPPQSPLPPQRRFEKHFQVIPDDETPEILKNCSPISGVKTSSPNCKRISPPHNPFVSSPGRRSSRKLILRSIPAFPSLNEHAGDLQ